LLDSRLRLVEFSENVDLSAGATERGSTRLCACRRAASAHLGSWDWAPPEDRSRTRRTRRSAGSPRRANGGMKAVQHSVEPSTVPRTASGHRRACPPTSARGEGGVAVVLAVGPLLPALPPLSCSPTTASSATATTCSTSFSPAKSRMQDWEGSECAERCARREVLDAGFYRSLGLGGRGENQN